MTGKMSKAAAKLQADRAYEREARARGGPTQSAVDRKRAAYRAAEVELEKVISEVGATVGGVGTTARELIDAMLARGFKITYGGERL